MENLKFEYEYLENKYLQKKNNYLYLSENKLFISGCTNGEVFIYHNINISKINDEFILLGSTNKILKKTMFA